MRKRTTEEFIEKAIEIHGDKYDYSDIVYDGNDKEVIIYCKKHKKKFSQRADVHLRGGGCTDCGVEKRTKKLTYTTLEKYYEAIEQFIEKAIDKHGDKYGYDRVKYVDNHTNVDIYCKKCKKYFPQTPNNHLAGGGCPDCGKQKRADSHRNRSIKNKQKTH